MRATGGAAATGAATGRERLLRTPTTAPSRSRLRWLPPRGILPCLIEIGTNMSRTHDDGSKAPWGSTNPPDSDREEAIPGVAPGKPLQALIQFESRALR